MFLIARVNERQRITLRVYRRMRAKQFNYLCACDTRDEHPLSLLSCIAGLPPVTTWLKMCGYLVFARHAGYYDVRRGSVTWAGAGACA